MPHTKTVLIALDGSHHSSYAFNWYVERFRGPGDQVVLAHVYQLPITPPPTPAQGVSLPSPQDYQNTVQRAESKAKELLSPYELKCRELEIPHKTVCAYGTVGEMLCAICQDENATCMIVGTRGHGTIRRTILGSVSDYAVKHNDVTVIVVPKNDHS